jgi:transcription antitermination factor NusG
MGPVAAWYGIWTRSHFERVVADQLAAKGFSPFLPEMPVWSSRLGTAHVMSAPMFPGYVFLRHAMEKGSYIEILKARGVVRVLEGGWNRLTPIPDIEIERIQQIASAGLPVTPHAYLHQGDRVRVIGGPLAGVEGIFLRGKANSGRLVLSIDLLRASVAVELDAKLVIPSEARSTI